MRTRRLLLAASALSTLAFGCSKDKTEPLPGNPKGSRYDAAVMPGDQTAPDAPIAPTARDATEPIAPTARDAAPTARDAIEPTAAPRPTYANTKGSYYDDAMLGDPVAADAPTDATRSRDAAGPRDAGTRDAAPADAAVPRDAAANPRDAAIRPLPGNPKGSRYDAGNGNDL